MHALSARTFDDRMSWSFDTKDGDDPAVAAMLQPLHSPQPLLEERPRRPSNKNKQQLKAAASTAQSMRVNSAVTTSNQETTPQVQLSDRQLADIARQAASAIEWDTLRARSSVWDRKKNIGDFGVYARQCGRAHQVMASGSVACSIAEMQRVLCTTSTARYAAAMRELHGPTFLTGTVVHKINTRLLDGSADAAGADMNFDFASRSHSHSHGSSSSSRDGRGCFDLTLKTATFAKAHMFARPERWCFLDLFQPQADKQKFVLSMHSVPAHDVLRPSATLDETASSTKQLDEVCAGYSITADPRRKLVWVVFFAQYVELDATGNGSSASTNNATSSGGFFARRQSASKRAAVKRLMQMAQAACHLPMIVHRRRLGAQVFVDPIAFAPPNAHCICCTTALPLLARKTRCHLCGYCVCASCSREHEVERAHTHLVAAPQRPVVRVCLTCERRVSGANYDAIAAGTLSPSAIQRSASNAPTPSVSLAGLLRDSFEHAVDDNRKRAVVQVIKSLLEHDDDYGGRDSRDNDDDRRDGSNQETIATTVSTTSRCSDSGSVTSDHALVDALATDLRVREFALEDCVLGNAASRNYPLAYRDERDDSAVEFPVPRNEDARLAGVRERRLSDIRNAPELEIICAIARQELQCATGIVTLVDEGEVHVVASSNALFQNVVVPRDHSICAHAVMSDKPLLVPHADADIRFNRIGAVQQGALSFYCGFPLIGPDNTVYGTVCCIDTEDHVVTQAQYAVMTKLAATAVRVMKMHERTDGA